MSWFWLLLLSTSPWGRRITEKRKHLELIDPNPLALLVKIHWLRFPYYLAKSRNYCLNPPLDHCLPRRTLYRESRSVGLDYAYPNHLNVLKFNEISTTHYSKLKFSISSTACVQTHGFRTSPILNGHVSEPFCSTYIIATVKSRSVIDNQKPRGRYGCHKLVNVSRAYAMIISPTCDQNWRFKCPSDDTSVSLNSSHVRTVWFRTNPIL